MYVYACICMYMRVHLWYKYSVSPICEPINSYVHIQCYRARYIHWSHNVRIYIHILAHMCVADVAQALAAAPLWRCCFKAQVVPFEVCVSEHTLLAQCRTILWH